MKCDFCNSILKGKPRYELDGNLLCNDDYEKLEKSRHLLESAFKQTIQITNLLDTGFILMNDEDVQSSEKILTWFRKSTDAILKWFQDRQIERQMQQQQDRKCDNEAQYIDMH